VQMLGYTWMPLGPIRTDPKIIRGGSYGTAFDIKSNNLELAGKNSIKIEGKPAEHMLKMMEALEDCDDVQNVYSNFDIADDVIEAMA